MTILLANNVSSTLSASLTASATSMTVANGSRFPALTSGQYFYATIIATTGVIEIVKVTARTGNVMTITRAQDGTNAQAFPSGARVEMRINAASVREAVTDQTGPLNTRLTTAEGDITSLEGRMTTVEADITAIGGDIAALEAFDTTLGTSVGSNSIGFIQSGSSATARTTQAKLRDTVSVKDFGAVGDGVANDTAAIQAALNSRATGGSLLFPPGTYKVTSAINATFNNGVMVHISGYGAKIDGTSLSGTVPGDTTLLTLGGARLTGVALSANVAKYALSLTTSPAITASINDIALITSTDLWDPSRPYYYKGEFIELRNISGTTITPHTPLYDSYTAATTTVHPLSTPTVVVEGLELIMDANQIALNVSYCRNPTLKNLKIHGSRYAGAYLTYCFGGSMEDCEVYDVWNGSTGTSYGLGVATCQNVVVKGNNITEARHCITGGGFEPSRNVIYTHNICTVHPSEPVAAAIDQHSNMELCPILNNVANGGITVSSINLDIKNNLVYETRNVLSAINIYQEINSDYYDISNNTIIVNTGTASGIFHTPTVSSISVNRFIVQGNNVVARNRAFAVAPRTNVISGCSINNLIVKNNYFRTTAAGEAAFTLSSSGVQFVNIATLNTSDNTMIAEAHDCFYLLNGLNTVFSTNDKFYGNRLNGYLANISGVDITLLNAYFEGNTGGAGVSRSIRYTSTGVARCINPTFKNITYKAELESGGPTDYIEQGWYSATPTILNPAGAKLVNFYGTLGRAITYGTAAPTTNTWAVGDRVYNQSPAVGQPKSWVCTVAGTPGTWVSEGNL